MKLIPRLLIFSIAALLVAFGLYFLSIFYADHLLGRMEMNMTRAEVAALLVPSRSEVLSADAIVLGKKYKPQGCESVVTYWIFGIHPIDVGYSREGRVVYSFPTFE